MKLKPITCVIIFIIGYAFLMYLATEYGSEPTNSNAIDSIDSLTQDCDSFVTKDESGKTLIIYLPKELTK